jgi:hypothetical protein
VKRKPSQSNIKIENYQNLLAYSSTSNPEQLDAPAADNDLRNDLLLQKRSKDTEKHKVPGSVSNR